MHGKRIEHIIDPGPMTVPPVVRHGLLGLGILGMVIFLVAAFTGGIESRQETWAGFMVSFLFFWLLSMGAAGFLAIQYTVHAKWFVAIKRLPEAVASFAWRGGFVFPILALAGMAYIYPWASSANYTEIWGHAGPDYPYEGTLKAVWLSNGAHIVKTFVYIGILTAITYMLVRVSADRNDGDGTATEKKRLKTSIIFLILYGPIFSLFAWEAIMSVEPKWFSTMFGVYIFSGAFVSAAAVMMLALYRMRRQTDHIQGRQMYDLGTYVMAFATFMVYIGFSQFMLIWYANIPDETFFYLKRYEGGWAIVTIAIGIFKWVVPFFVLMPPPLRTNRVAQTVCCASILFGQLLDLYWIIYPVYFGELHFPSIINIVTFLGVFGIFGWSVLSYLTQKSILPVEDADLLSSVNGDYLHA